MALLSIPEIASKLSLLDASKVPEWSATTGFGSDPTQPWAYRPNTYQQVWVDIDSSPLTNSRIAYVHADFYNGAFSTTQCEILLDAIQWALALPDLKAIVMLGGPGYFSNGIALNVIEGSPDPSAEGWANINAIDDCVQALLAPKGVVTFAAMRGNAAAGGLAMATAADFVICAESAVLNPHYRGLGLFGSEWHTYSWYERCGARVAAKIAREMLPMSSHEAKQVGLVDCVVANDGMSGEQLLGSIKKLVNEVMDAKVHDAARADSGIVASGAPWTRSLRPASADAAESMLLSDQILRNKTRYQAYIFAESEAAKSLTLDQHFQRYRKHELDQMTLDFFHPHRNQRFASRCTGFVRKLVPASTPMRFALHRRYEGGEWWAASNAGHLDEEEKDEFDGLADYPASAAVARLPSLRPEFVPHRVELSRTTRAYSAGQETLSSAVSGDADTHTALGNDSQRSSTSTAPTTPSEGSPKTVLSLGDEEAQRVEIEAEQLRVRRVEPGAGLLGDNGALKRGPTVISFVDAKKGEVDGRKGDAGIKVLPERGSSIKKVSAPKAAAAMPTKEATETTKKQSKIQRFFSSLSRKSRANLQVEQISPYAVVPPLPKTELAPAFQPTPANPEPSDAEKRQRRRSSISDVFSILQTANRPASGAASHDSAASTKTERRRSWRPTSSSGSSLSDRSPGKSLPPTPSISKASGFQPNVAATPKIVEEAFASEKVGTPGEVGEANCLWSCYYGEDGVKHRSPAMVVGGGQQAGVAA